MPDWSKVERFPEFTVFCWCGMEYRSHTMFDKDIHRMAVKKPCPKCGKSDNAKRISSDPETMTL